MCNNVKCLRLVSWRLRSSNASSTAGNTDAVRFPCPGLFVNGMIHKTGREWRTWDRAGTKSSHVSTILCPKFTRTPILRWCLSLTSYPRPSALLS
ncbi:hypothetical protein DPEC_G00140940 [Dallia pectoralis]|uniref:Uncharacterized protein n=1 Tax=Dallia pectoralis TaxID=75939 RepID=A0ACC2GN77_DALPE|nr:hypothetical protein DPEC_G00140940 [Dallia pectoralis]